VGAASQPRIAFSPAKQIAAGSRQVGMQAKAAPTISLKNLSRAAHRGCRLKVGTVADSTLS
jgi:hypothetical protein